LGLGDQVYDTLSPELKESMTEYYYVNSLHNYEEVLRAVGYFTHKYGKIGRIESQNEFWLELDAALRKDFNVWGRKPEEMGLIKKKSEMKQRYMDLGLNVAKGRVVNSYAEAVAYIEEIGLPVCAKPDIGVGAVKTYKIQKIEDLQQVNFDFNYIIEEFISGHLISFDGFVDTDGQIVFYTVDDFSQPVLEVANHRAHIWYYSHREIPEEVREVGFKIVEGFNLRERFFHIEFFKCPDGKLVNLEINCRPPGGYTMDMFNYANNIDLYNYYAKVVCGKKPVLEYNRPYHALYVSRKAHYKYKYSHEEIVNKYVGNLMMHTALPLGLALLGEYCYIFRFKTMEEVKSAVATVWASPFDEQKVSAPLPLQTSEVVEKSQ